MSSNFNLNTLKGRLAEQLIQDLFINITPESSYTLGRVRSFHFNVESIQEYTEYARLLFGAFNTVK